MKNLAFVAIVALAISGCTTANSTDSKNTTYDLTAVCITDEGTPVSKGMTYKGKTCSEPDTTQVYPKPNLVWR